MNVGQLKQSTEEYLEYDIPEDIWPELIKQAERRIFQRCYELECFKQDINFRINQTEETVVAGFDVKLRSIDGLYKRTDSYISRWTNATNPDGTPLVGEPKYYSVRHRREDSFVIRFAPTPDPNEEYVRRMHLYNIVDPLNPADDNSENWISKAASNVMLYALIVEAATYLHHDIAPWMARYEEAVSLLMRDAGLQNNTEAGAYSKKTAKDQWIWAKIPRTIHGSGMGEDII